MSRAPVIDVADLVVRIETADRGFDAVNGVSFSVAPGETFALVGESGSGKSLTALSLMRLLPEGRVRIAGGSIGFDGRDLASESEGVMRTIRGNRIAMVFQEPMTSLNPAMRVGRQVAEVLELHRGLSRTAAMAEARALFEKVRIPDPKRRLDEYPHRMSGGMRQRVMIALALACTPDLIIADEPTTALDVTIQAQILELFASLQRDHGAALLLITHDLSVVAETADRVAVMYAGRIVETAGVVELFDRPLHPYTRGLLASIPDQDDGEADNGRFRLTEIPGTVPPLWALPAGCAFAPRCPMAVPSCREAAPRLTEVAPGHRVACIRVGSAEAGR